VGWDLYGLAPIHAPTPLKFTLHNWLSSHVHVVFAHYWMEELMADADVLKCTDTDPQLQNAVLVAESKTASARVLGT
jgi:hypothetical protein